MFNRLLRLGFSNPLSCGGVAWREPAGEYCDDAHGNEHPTDDGDGAGTFVHNAVVVKRPELSQEEPELSTTNAESANAPPPHFPLPAASASAARAAAR